MEQSKMKRFGLMAVVVLAVVVAVGFFLTRDRGEPLTYRFVEVTRGSVESSVTATGKLSAVRTVQVGTQVSGQVKEIFVDFNDMVKKGQVIARLDPQLLQQQVRQVQVEMERVKADVAQKKYELDQATPLFDAKVITETEFNTAQYNYTVAQSNMKAQQVNYDRAMQNLNYSTIYAPIDGIVVERNVEPGQTVAASMSTPQLFLLAEDLRNMQILVNVDESDIGSIHEGQKTRFTVQAYPDRNFEGTVQQVRLQNVATENVVNYTVVVSVSNDDGVLLPGMTASVAFEVQRADNVLKVPAAALRFRAPEEMLAMVGMDSVSRRKTVDSLRAAGGESRSGDNDRVAAATPGSGDAGRAGQTAGGREGQAGTQTQAPGAQTPGATPGAAPGGQRIAQGPGMQTGQGGQPMQGGQGSARRGGGGGMLFYVDEGGKLQVMRIRTGITNGQETVVMGEGLKEGMQVIAGVTGGNADEEGAANPFGGQQQQGRGGFGRGAF